MNNCNYCVDIIIPVYNAFHELKECLESVKKYTDLNRHKVIIVNDRSTDERVLPYIQSQTSDNIILLNNEINLGFSGSVNKGINYSNQDIILLNSDTIVTENWIEKMVKCAYSDVSIGTVTPLSNNATICSVPKFGQDNELPDSVTVDEYAKIVEECSLREYPRIPVAMGFCMLIKREAIKYAGLFDADTYGRGYGEENDFCYRLEQLGYWHAMCDDTFIYHKGKMSFSSEEKQAFIEQNEQILVGKYPVQMDKTHIYWNNNPHQYIRDNIAISMSLKNNKKNVLYLVQADFREDASNNIGGTQFHVKDLTMELRNEYNIFVAARDGEVLRLTAYIENEVYSFKHYIGAATQYPVFHDERLQKVIRSILNGFKIDLVHVHHTLSLSLDIYYEAYNLGIPIILTLHDFYYVCPTFLLLDIENKLCIDRTNKEYCKECLNKKMGISECGNYIDKWRSEIKKVLSMCKQVIIPSQSAKNIFCRYYPEMENNILVINHASEQIEQIKIEVHDSVCITPHVKASIEYLFNKEGNPYLISGWAYLENKDSRKSKVFVEISNSKGEKQVLKCYLVDRIDIARINEKYIRSGFSIVVPTDMLSMGKVDVKVLILHEKEIYTDGKIVEGTVNDLAVKQGFNIAFVGGMSLAKGSQVAYNLIKNSNNHINWYLFGGIGDSDLYNMERSNLIKTGWYDREDLPMLLENHKIDLVCILSIVPETFCFTLSEAILSKVPILATDIGALGERIRQTECGWLVPVDADYKEIMKVIEQIENNREEYEQKLTNLHKCKIKTVTQMGQEYSKIYLEQLSDVEEVEYESVDKKDLYSIDTSLNTNIAEMNSFLHQRLNLVENELQSVYSSIVYKILIRIKKIKLPFKTQIKKVIIWSIKVLKETKK